MNSYMKCSYEFTIFTTSYQFVHEMTIYIHEYIIQICKIIYRDSEFVNEFISIYEFISTDYYYYY